MGERSDEYSDPLDRARDLYSAGGASANEKTVAVASALGW